MDNRITYDCIKIGNIFFIPAHIDCFEYDKKLNTIFIRTVSGKEFLFNTKDCNELIDAFGIRKYL